MSYKKAEDAKRMEALNQHTRQAPWIGGSWSGHLGSSKPKHPMFGCIASQAGNCRRFSPWGRQF
jgi:hypothetical protein